MIFSLCFQEKHVFQQSKLCEAADQPAAVHQPFEAAREEEK